MTDIDNAAQLIKDLALGTASPEVLEPGRIYGYMTEGGPKVVDLTGDEHLDEPKRKRGTVTVEDVAGFAQYFAKHHDEDSEVFADIGAHAITAVLNAHHGADNDFPDSLARWQDHRLILRLAVTPEWAAWAGSNRTMMPQVPFAEFIEDHLADIAADGPCTGADLLEMAQEFHAHGKTEFKQGTRLASGQTQLVYTETIDAKAGERGQITIPGAFELGIRVFDDLEPYRVKARFRYRITDGALKLGYHLNDPERVVRDAVGLVVAKAEAACGVKIMLGRPS